MEGDTEDFVGLEVLREFLGFFLVVPDTDESVSTASHNQGLPDTNIHRSDLSFMRLRRNQLKLRFLYILLVLFQLNLVDQICAGQANQVLLISTWRHRHISDHDVFDIIAVLDVQSLGQGVWDSFVVFGLVVDLDAPVLLVANNEAFVDTDDACDFMRDLVGINEFHLVEALTVEDVQLSVHCPKNNILIV